MKTRVISLLIALCLLVGLIPAVSAETVASGTCGENLTWRYERVIEDAMMGLISETLYIEGEGEMYDYSPDAPAPWSDLYISSLQIGPGVTSIGSYAFYECSGFQTLNLSDTNITRIGTMAFANTGVTTAYLPKGLTEIADSLFSQAYRLTHVDIPDSVTSIGNSAFTWSKVEELIIPESVTKVGDCAFDSIPGPIYFKGDAPEFVPHMTQLEDHVAQGSFGYYGGTIYYPPGNDTWAEAIAQNSYGEHTWAEYVAPSGTCGENLTWTLEYDTLYIDGEGDMYDYGWDDHAPWYELTFDTLVLGPGVSSVGNYAFRMCESLATTNLGESNVRRIGQWAFAGTDISREAVPEGVTKIEDGAFRGTSRLQELILPESLVHIGYNAFAFSTLPKLVIPKNVQSMGDAVFEYSYTDVWFVGDAPELSYVNEKYEEYQGTFGLFKGSIYYPSNNPTWTEDITVVVNGWYEWIPYILNPFNDVPETSFYHDSVMWAIEKGITNGLTPTEFGPTSLCNRAQVVTFLWRAAGSPEPETTTHDFVDVQAGSFYEKPVLWALENGITTGSDATHFNPTGDCNRAQVVTFIYRAFESPAVENADNPFTDVPEKSWYTAPVLWAVEQGITNGLSATTFGPTQSCNRAQVVTFLYRAYSD